MPSSKIIALLIFLLPVIFIEAQDSVVPYRKGDKWGVVTLNRKKEIVPAVYQNIYIYKSWISVYTGNKFGLFSIKGVRTLEDDYEDIHVVLDDSSGTVISCRKKNLIALVDAHGKNITPYDSCLFSLIEESDKIRVSCGYRNTTGEGVVDRMGNTVIAKEWRQIYKKGKYFFARPFTKGQNVTVFTEEGKKIPCSINPTNETKTGLYIYIDQEKGLYGLADSLFRPVTPPLSVFLQESAKHPGIFIFRGLRNEDRSGLLDKEGKFILDVNGYVNEFGKNLVWVQQKKYSLHDIETGKKIIREDFEEVRNFYSGHKIFSKIKYENKWGIINESGKVILKCKWDEILSYSPTAIIVRDGNKIKILRGKTISTVKNSYDHYSTPSDGMICVTRNDSVGFINFKGKEIIPVSYNLMLFNQGQFGNTMPSYPMFYKGRAVVLKKDTALLIDKTNKEISRLLPQEVSEDPYMSIDSLTNDFALHAIDVKSLKIYFENGKYGLKKRNGELALAAQYEKITRADKNIYLLYKEGKIALMDKNFSILTKFKFDSVENYSENLFFVKVNGKECFLGKDLTAYFEEL